VDTFVTPTGFCNVFPLGSIDRDAIVVCASDVPDRTGDGLPEMEVRVLEIRRLGRLSCASYVLLNPACPESGSCLRYLSVDRTCF
jgi:hypothetical protein